MEKPPILDSPPDATTIQSIERPHARLLTYYALCCLAIPPLFPILILPHYFRYHTMRYRFDAEGVSMRWGILFRREVILNYSRIQDIHLQSNFVERWLGLGRVLIQTASGSSNAEMTIEGLLEFEAVRDYLYAKMRGVKEKGATPHGGGEAQPAGRIDPAALAELVSTLKAVGDEVRSLRETIERQKSGGAGG
jgi:membrane protein YdbS with pleckstrin-like domain